MKTDLPSVQNTNRMPIVSEGETDVQVHPVPGRTAPLPPGPTMSPQDRQEARMRTNVSRELEKLGFNK